MMNFKVVLLGSRAAGKTCLVTRFLHHHFNEHSPPRATIGAAYGSKVVTISNQPVQLSIWDTAGSERFNAMTKIYYRGAAAAILCFDLTDSESFERAKYWYQELKNTEENCRVYLCGTKYDLLVHDNQQRGFDVDLVKNYAQNLNICYIETSSKTGENIDELFLKVAGDLITHTDHAPKWKGVEAFKVAAAIPSRCSC